MSKILIHTNEAYAELGDLYGIFFEDINHAADGGLYGELVQNRSFDFDGVDHKLYHAFTAWEKIREEGAEGEVFIGRKNPVHKNQPNYAVLVNHTPGKIIGLKNMGYNEGIPIRRETFRFSCFARAEVPMSLKVRLESKEGSVYAEGEIRTESAEWKQYEILLESSGEDFCGRLSVSISEEGRICLDMISLFPVDTFMGRKNGMRKDLAQMLKDMKPKFMRFPGGCLVHDGSLDRNDRNSLYFWKNTIGEIWERPSRRNNWGYNQSLGLGYYEYFQFCEDIGAQPLPVLPGAYDPHHKREIAIDELGPWIDDALDLIEFANGDETTKWGAIRAKMGHKEPFGLKYLAIGNEEVGEAFFERYPYFHQAIKEKYPEIMLINSASPFAEGSEYQRGWQSARKWHSDLIDEHYYEAPEWLLANYHRYDHLDPAGPKVFLGEYASLNNSYGNAVAEAAYMTGLEKNAQVVKLACYAPLLCNKDYANWKPDMIWFDNHRVYGSTSYYTQKMFMTNQGEKELRAEDDFERPVVPTPMLTGKVRIKTDECEIRLWDIAVTTQDDSKQTIFKEQTLSKKKKQLTLCDISCPDYDISFRAKKLSGSKGLVLYFGEKEKESLNWTIGGWQNQDSTLSAKYNSEKESCLTQSLFEFELQREYLFTLKVRGRMLSTYVDGVLQDQVEYKHYCPEPLYYCASREGNEVIVKLVNVREEDEEVELVFDGMDAADKPEAGEERKITGTAEILAGYSPKAENSLKKPEAVKPVIRQVEGTGNVLPWHVPALSVQVLRISVL